MRPSWFSISDQLPWTPFGGLDAPFFLPWLSLSPFLLSIAFWCQHSKQWMSAPIVCIAGAWYLSDKVSPEIGVLCHEWMGISAARLYSWDTALLQVLAWLHVADSFEDYSYSFCSWTSYNEGGQGRHTDPNGTPMLLWTLILLQRWQSQLYWIRCHPYYLDMTGPCPYLLQIFLSEQQAWWYHKLGALVQDHSDIWMVLNCINTGLQRNAHQRPCAPGDNHCSLVSLNAVICLQMSHLSASDQSQLAAGVTQEGIAYSSIQDLEADSPQAG